MRSEYSIRAILSAPALPTGTVVSPFDSHLIRPPEQLIDGHAWMKACLDRGETGVEPPSTVNLEGPNPDSDVFDRRISSILGLNFVFAQPGLGF